MGKLTKLDFGRRSTEPLWSLLWIRIGSIWINYWLTVLDPAASGRIFHQKANQAEGRGADFTFLRDEHVVARECWALESNNNTKTQVWRYIINSSIPAQQDDLAVLPPFLKIFKENYLRSTTANMLLNKILALTLPLVAFAAPVAEPAPLKDADLVGVSA